MFTYVVILVHELAAPRRCGKHTILDLGENKSEHKGGNLAYFNIKGLQPVAWSYIQPIERPTSRTTIGCVPSIRDLIEADQFYPHNFGLTVQIFLLG